MRSGGAAESRLAYVVDLLVQLRRDAESPEPELHRRDRALMPEGARAAGRRQLLLRWLDALRVAGYWFPGAMVSTVFRAQLLGLGVAGAATGWLVTAALFRYDGSRPVNVVHVLTGLVGVQLLLLLLLGVVSLPHWIAGRIPGLRIVQDLVGWLSPGQFTRWLARRLPDPLRGPALGGGLAWAKDPWPTRILKWAAMVSAQGFGVAFNVGALAAALYLVTFSDLAFSWSTTLIPDIDRGHRVTRLLSAPWSGWWPAAVPSRDLIEATLYYRQDGTSEGMDPAGWGGWWPFLVASVGVYGLLPRLILLGVGGLRLNSVLRGAMTGAAGVSEAVDRLTTEAISTRAVQPEEAAPVAVVSSAHPGGGVPAGRYRVVNWGGVETDLEQVRQGFAGRGRIEVIGLDAAGGASGLETDGATIRKIADVEGAPGVMILVRSWEPPMLEFLDFLEELRRQLGRGRRLVVLLVGLGRDGELGAPRQGDVAQWRRRLETLMDAEMTVAVWGKEEA